MDAYNSLSCHRDHLLEQYKGKPVSALPTPSFIVDMAVVRANCRRMLDRLDDLHIGLTFRPHVKTHKVEIFLLL